MQASRISAVFQPLRDFWQEKPQRPQRRERASSSGQPTIRSSLATGIGSDIQRPLATVILGGLLSTLILAPFLLPVAYYCTERNRK